MKLAGSFMPMPYFSTLMYTAVFYDCLSAPRRRSVGSRAERLSRRRMKKISVGIVFPLHNLKWICFNSSAAT